MEDFEKKELDERMIADGHWAHKFMDGRALSLAFIVADGGIVVLPESVIECNRILDAANYIKWRRANPERCKELFG